MSNTNTPATQLVQAYRNRQPIAAIPESGPAIVEHAYAMQRVVWQQLVGDVRPGAWKVGTPERGTEPTAAAIFPRRLARSPAHFSVADFRTLGIEAEIALCLGQDLPVRTEVYRREEILAAIASVHVAIELVDTRLANPEHAGPLWRLADSLLNGGLVIGAKIPGWRAVDFSGLTVRVQANGRCIAETIGRQPLDDLFYCLPWWINHIGGARVGDIITTGAWNGMHPLCLPTEASVEFIGLGRADVRID